jgi:hypothetical protein
MRIYVDFDGVLINCGRFPYILGLVPGAREAMEALRASGHHVTIFSTRANKKINKPATRALLMQIMRAALSLYRIPYDAVEDHKPAYDLLIDDRCIRFHNWDTAMREVATFEPVDWSSVDGEGFNEKEQI